VNVAVLVLLLSAAGWLTVVAIYEDRGARWTEDKLAEQMDQEPATFLLQGDAAAITRAIAADIEERGQQSPYQGRSPIEQFDAYFAAHPEAKPPAFDERAATWRAFQKSRSYLAAVDAAHREAARSRDLAATGIPPAGALSLLENDPLAQGPKLFRRHCAACHSHTGSEDSGRGAASQQIASDENTASNLYQFASRDWIGGLLDPQQVASPHYFGNTPFADGEMVQFVQTDIGELRSDMESEELAEFNRELEDVVIALSAEAGLPAQHDADEADAARIQTGRAAMVDAFACTQCHQFHDQGMPGKGPDLTGYGSREWLIDFVSDPGHARFYGERNVMPPFFEDAASPGENKLTRRELELLVDWLRGDWHRP
jgi:ubiquinol-cytochrome c reductase cytochrome b subunit